MASESDLITRSVMSMDLSQEAMHNLAIKYSPNGLPSCSFAQAIGAEVLGCAPNEITDEQIVVIEHALARRNWGGPNE